MESTKQQVVQSLREMIPKEHDDYNEIKYSDTFYIHVWSHDEGKGKFELELIVPLEEIDIDKQSQENSYDEVYIGSIDGSREVISMLEDACEEVTESNISLEFNLVEVVDDGVWETPASVYSSFKLSMDN